MVASQISGEFSSINSSILRPLRATDGALEERLSQQAEKLQQLSQVIRSFESTLATRDAETKAMVATQISGEISSINSYNDNAGVLETLRATDRKVENALTEAEDLRTVFAAEASSVRSSMVAAAANHLAAETRIEQRLKAFEDSIMSKLSAITEASTQQGSTRSVAITGTRVAVGPTVTNTEVPSTTVAPLIGPAAALVSSKDPVTVLEAPLAPTQEVAAAEAPAVSQFEDSVADKVDETAEESDLASEASSKVALASSGFSATAEVTVEDIKPSDAPSLAGTLEASMAPRDPSVAPVSSPRPAMTHTSPYASQVQPEVLDPLVMCLKSLRVCPVQSLAATYSGDQVMADVHAGPSHHGDVSMSVAVTEVQEGTEDVIDPVDSTMVDDDTAGEDVEMDEAIQEELDRLVEGGDPHGESFDFPADLPQSTPPYVPTTPDAWTLTETSLEGLDALDAPTAVATSAFDPSVFDAGFFGLSPTSLNAQPGTIGGATQDTAVYVPDLGPQANDVPLFDEAAMNRDQGGMNMNLDALRVEVQGAHAADMAVNLDHLHRPPRARPPVLPSTPGARAIRQPRSVLRGTAQAIPGGAGPTVGPGSAAAPPGVPARAAPPTATPSRAAPPTVAPSSAGPSSVTPADATTFSPNVPVLVTSAAVDASGEVFRRSEQSLGSAFKAAMALYTPQASGTGGPALPRTRTTQPDPFFVVAAQNPVRVIAPRFVPAPPMAIYDGQPACLMEGETEWDEHFSLFRWDAFRTNRDRLGTFLRVDSDSPDAARDPYLAQLAAVLDYMVKCWKRDDMPTLRRNVPLDLLQAVNLALREIAKQYDNADAEHQAGYAKSVSNIETLFTATGNFLADDIDRARVRRQPFADQAIALVENATVFAGLAARWQLEPAVQENVESGEAMESEESEAE